MIDLDVLEKLARAATPGPWATDDPWIVYAKVHDEIVYLAKTAELDTTRTQYRKDADYIAAANPAVILDLIGIARAAADSLPKIKEGAKLPKLPEPYYEQGHTFYSECARIEEDLYTADQMREYAADVAVFIESARLAAPASQAAAHAAAIALAGETIDARNEEVAALKAALIDCARHPRKAQRDNIVAKALAGAAPVEAAKPEGWTANTGAQPDIDGGAMVEVELFTGYKIARQASSLDWRRDGDSGDIVRWRLAAPAPEAQ